VEVWVGIDRSHRKLVDKKYPKYPLGTYVLKRPDVGTNRFTRRALNYDPETYQIVRAEGENYTVIKSLFGTERIRGLRYWMIHPIKDLEALNILKNPTNVSYIKRKIMNKYKINQEEAMDRIRQAKANLEKVILLSPD
jgi:hypothetical protein